MDPRFTVYQIIAEPIRNFRKLTKKEEEREINDLLAMMELPEEIKLRKAHELKKNGFLKMNQDYDFVLTDSGRAIASCIYEKHCYFKDISCKEIAMQALKTACTFYGGDWAGTLEVDLDFDV